MNSEKYVLFDFDGTLVDTGNGVTNAVAYALERFGIAVADRRELFPYIGPPLLTSFREFHHMTEEQSQQALAYYREYYRERGMFEVTPYPGMAELLARLQADGYSLLIATSKPEEFTNRILRNIGMDNYFAFVAGNTLDESRPTKESVIAYILRRYPAICRKNTLMVGDRHYDVTGAGKFNIPTVGVLFGFGSREELTSAGAVAVAADAKELEQIIRARLD